LLNKHYMPKNISIFKFSIFMYMSLMTNFEICPQQKLVGESWTEHL